MGVFQMDSWENGQRSGSRAVNVVSYANGSCVFGAPVMLPEPESSAWTTGSIAKVKNKTDDGNRYCLITQ